MQRSTQYPVFDDRAQRLLTEIAGIKAKTFAALRFAKPTIAHRNTPDRACLTIQNIAETQAPQ